eukprot:CAMPEP_0202958984 /NCGR_PEP_ID=MMETSP1396-20130829/3246_1 /ASSEMBLY_ACC=CAM_ASM_000872 /TAXON_ID= /ORGANISM="Pseudokeronopsis sp., Strain Brazil" /LENGTH=67 /DNA_ID=CAMNT_0049677323 /DNA_START=230 /DNA_END=433 /DNA_ORIENTATION=-
MHFEEYGFEVEISGYLAWTLYLFGDYPDKGYSFTWYLNLDIFYWAPYKQIVWWDTWFSDWVGSKFED